MTKCAKDVCVCVGVCVVYTIPPFPLTSPWLANYAMQILQNANRLALFLSFLPGRNEDLKGKKKQGDRWGGNRIMIRIRQDATDYWQVVTTMIGPPRPSVL